MFTGIIEEIGKITQISKSSSSYKMQIRCSKILDDCKLGDSIAVNGVCLTVSNLNAQSFTADVMPVTFQKSTLKNLHIASSVNLERAMPASGRFGGHMVSGHVDGIGSVTKISKAHNAILLTISTKPETIKFLIPEGSITLDGISLTITELHSNTFTCSLIPHTYQHTIIQYKKIGSLVNIEVDTVGKYLYHFINKQKSSRSLDRNFLIQNGF